MSHGMHAKPAPGDITICIQCQSILVFGDNLKPRWPTEAEMLDIAGRRDIVMAQRALFQAKRDKGLTK
jgi:hypothetical protein